ncbi:MAG: FIG003033: Helicase domain protein, partial [uncultured Lysobacter sp.]
DTAGEPDAAVVPAVGGRQTRPIEYRRLEGARAARGRPARAPTWPL